MEQLLFFRNYIQTAQLCASSYFWMLINKDEIKSEDNDFIGENFKGSSEKMVYFHTSNTSVSPIKNVTYKPPVLAYKEKFSVIECLFKDKETNSYKHTIIPHDKVKQNVYINFEGYKRKLEIPLFHVPNLLGHLKY